MDEKTKTIIDRARALLVSMAGVKMAAQQGCGPLTHGIAVDILGARLFMEADDRIAAGTLQAIAAAPGMLTSLCDALESAERRAEEAEAQAAATMAVIREIRETCCAALGDGLETIVTTGVVRILRDRLHSAEARAVEDEQLRLRLVGDLAMEQRHHELARGRLKEVYSEMDGLRAELASVDAGVCPSCSSAWWAREHDQNAAKDQVAAAETALRAERVRASVAQVATNAAVRDLVSMAGECEHLREKLAAAEAKSARMVARVCAGCHGRGLAHLDGDSPRCAACGGSGAVIVEGGE